MLVSRRRVENRESRIETTEEAPYRPDLPIFLMDESSVVDTRLAQPIRKQLPGEMKPRRTARPVMTAKTTLESKRRELQKPVRLSEGQFPSLFMGRGARSGMENGYVTDAPSATGVGANNAARRRKTRGLPSHRTRGRRRAVGTFALVPSAVDGVTPPA